MLQGRYATIGVLCVETLKLKMAASVYTNFQLESWNTCLPFASFPNPSKQKLDDSST